MRRWIIYYRVSGKKQETLHQLQLCEEKVRSIMQPGDEIFYFDEGQTTTRLPMDQRPKLKEMLDFVRKGDTVVVFSLDRLARKGSELSHIYDDLLISQGIKVISLKQGEMKPSMIHIWAFVAQEERDSISFNTTEALKAKQDRMEKVGRTWYGFKLDHSILNPRKDHKTYNQPYKLIPEPDEYRLCLEMIRLRDLFHTYEEIVDMINKRGHRTREGKPFSKMSVYRIIQRRERYDPDLLFQEDPSSHQSRSLCAV